MRDARFWWLLLGLLTGLSLALAACGPAATQAVSPLATPAGGNPPLETREPQEVTAVPDEAQEIVAQVKKDLAARLNVADSEIDVTSIKAVQWNDSSLGCPKPGMAYATVITPGYVLILKAGDQEYTYHTGPNRFVLCSQENQVEAIETGEQPAHEAELSAEMAALVEQARKDLAERLKAAPEAISLHSMEAVQWRDSSLGCPRPGMNYLTVITPGYRIRLIANGQSYEYHTDKQKAVYCDNPQPPLDSQTDEQQVVEVARADLAQRLNISPGEIQVVKVEAVQWRDSSLGCPRPGMMYLQVITPGYQIILSAQGREYDYRATTTHAFLCEK